MDTLRKPFFIAALALLVLALLVELGAVEFLRAPVGNTTSLTALVAGDPDLREALNDLDPNEIQNILSQPKPPGLAIRDLALVDVLLVFTVGLIGASLLISQRLQARVQGCATLIVSLIVLILSIVAIIAALVLLLLMVSLFLAAPFGTLAYLAIYGFFNRAGANVVLGLTLSLKIAAVVCLVLAQQRFLQNRGLVLLILTSLLAALIVGFLHGLVPVILVSITDAIAAIIVSILALIWALFMLIGSLIAVIRALRVDRV